MKRTGMMVEYIFLIGGLILILLFVSYWQQMGMSLASERFGTLKVHTSTQVKNVILLLQTAPVQSETCVPINGCDRIAIHRDYVEIWGAQKEYFKEPSYLSTGYSSEMLDIYAEDDKGKIEEVGEEGFVTVCGATGSVFVVCIRNQYLPKAGGNYAENPSGSGIFEKVGEGKGTHEKILVITRQTDLVSRQSVV